MKKLFLVFAVLAAMVLMISCGGGNSGNTDNSGNGACTPQGSFRCNGGYSQKCDREWMNFELCSTEKPCNSTTGKCEAAGGNGSSDSGSNDEGIYFGIIGFNEYQYIKEIGLLNTYTVSGYTNFISSLESENGTGLYYADYKALEMMNKQPKPSKLQNVALVTFTDGLDNVSLNDEYNPENYNSTDAYRDALHNKIVNEKIHGLSVEAYTIGLKGKDVTDDAKFEETLKKLASKDSNVFQVSDMDEVKESFAKIAQALYSVSKTEKLDVKVPGGYDDGQLLRFTFDDPDTATESELYIEATFRRSNGRTLENITYHGFKNGKTSISSDDKDGAYYHFVFEELKYDDDSTPDTDDLMLWKKTSTGGWDRESEFDPESSSIVTEDKSSALIMLVLDCTTSLGSDFSRMQQAAKEFVSTLVSGNSGNNSGESGNGDSDPNDESTDDPSGNPTTADTCKIDDAYASSSFDNYYTFKGAGTINDENAEDVDMTTLTKTSLYLYEHQSYNLKTSQSYFLNATLTNGWKSVVLMGMGYDGSYPNVQIQAIVPDQWFEAIDQLKEEDPEEYDRAPFAPMINVTSLDIKWKGQSIDWYKQCTIAINKYAPSEIAEGDMPEGSFQYCYGKDGTINPGQTIKFGIDARLTDKFEDIQAAYNEGVEEGENDYIATPADLCTCVSYASGSGKEIECPTDDLNL